MRKMIRQNFPYRLQFNFELTLTYSCHYIRKEKPKDFLIKNETEIHQIF